MIFDFHSKSVCEMEFVDTFLLLTFVRLLSKLLSNHIFRFKMTQQKTGIKKRKPLQSRISVLVEHRRFELLTPTLPVLCATNCANAPRFSENYDSILFLFCKALI